MRDMNFKAATLICLEIGNERYSALKRTYNSDCILESDFSLLQEYYLSVVGRFLTSALKTCPPNHPLMRSVIQYRTSYPTVVEV